jgi:superfamily II DNA or RNA helicase
MFRIFENPESLEAAGFQLAPLKTLEQDSLFNQYLRKQLKLYLSNPYIQARPPRPYQAKYAALYACRASNFPIWDMGVGKSFLACMVIHLWYGDALKRGVKTKGNKSAEEAGFVRPGAIQIVAPRHTLKLTWLDKELKAAGLSDYVQIIFSEDDIVKSDKPIWLYSYDLLSRQTYSGKKMSSQNREEEDPNKLVGMRKRGQTRYFLGRTISRLIARQYPPKLLIADEIHRLRANTERTRCFKQVSRKAKEKIGMTGTPMDGWVEHISTVLGITYGLETKQFPYTEEIFTKKFTRVKTVNQDWATGEESKVSKERQVPGVNPAQLPEFYRATKHLMHRLMIRDPEVDGQVQFPPVNLHVMELSMTKDHEDFYNKVRKEQEGAIQATLDQVERGEITVWKGKKTVLGKIQNLRAASSFPWSVDFTDPVDVCTEKIKTTIDICNKAKQDGRKVIVFTSFINTGNKIYRSLLQAGIGAVRVYATDENSSPKTLSPSMRDERIEQFQESDVEDCTVLVANIALISEGLTLTEASVIINHDHSWRALVRAQGISRVVRPGGRMEGVDVYELLHKGTVDKYVWDLVWAKELANRALVDREVEAELMNSELDALAIAKQIVSTNNLDLVLSESEI